MTDIQEARKALVARVLQGAGEASPFDRQAAFDNHGLAEPLRSLVDGVATHAWRVTGEDFSAARSSGLSEDRIFEIVVCAAVGQATRQYDVALAALETAMGKD